MPRDTSYRWVCPRKAYEYYVGAGLGGVDYIEGLRWLRDHVIAGNIRVMFDGVPITSRIAQLLLELRKLTLPDEPDKVPLPPDFALNAKDIDGLLKRKATPAKRPGRPKRSGLQEAADREFVHRMNQMVSSYGTEAEYRRTFGRELPWPTFPSPWAAATYLVELGEVLGPGEPDSKIRRLVTRYKKMFGDND